VYLILRLNSPIIFYICSTMNLQEIFSADYIDSSIEEYLNIPKVISMQYLDISMFITHIL